MPRSTKRTHEIRAFLLESVSTHPRDLAAVAAKQFGLTRQAINRHITYLVDEGSFVASGATRSRSYELAVLSSDEVSQDIQGLEEHVLWRTRVAPLLESIPIATLDIWHYGFTEMVNNVIDHSGGTNVFVSIERTAVSTVMWISDNGIGIFRKIKSDLNLEDERHAILELSKGKLTTDPDNHSGEGIFFSSRMFDEYAILSGEVYFSHRMEKDEDWIIERDQPKTGTSVFMLLSNNTTRTTKEVLDKYTTKDGDYGFTRTVVPVRLLRHGVEKLVSRSQAKRLLARFDCFRVVVLDFSGVDTIGQAFSDEIFRVFATQNPQVRIVPVNMRPDVRKMVKRVQ